MELPVDDFNFLVSMQALAEYHKNDQIQASAENLVVLNPQAAYAFVSGHVLYYLCYNLSLQRELQLDVRVDGNPGEPASAETCRANWTRLFEALYALGIDVPDNAAEKLHTVEAMRELFTSIRAAHIKREQELNAEAEESKKKTSHKPMTAEESIALAKKKHQRRQRQQKLEELQKQRQHQEEMRLREKMTSRLDVDKIREKFPLLPQDAPAVLKEFDNRGVAQFCYGIISDIVDHVSSGEASVTVRQLEIRALHARAAARDRKQQGARLMDAKPLVSVQKGQDHRLVLAIRDIVLEVVEEACRPDIIDVLIQRDERRRRDRRVVNDMLARSSVDAEQVEQLPLKLRLEREKEERARAAKEEQAAKDEKLQQWRKVNRERSIAAAKEKEAAEKKKEQVAEQKRADDMRRADKEARHQLQTKHAVALYRLGEDAIKKRDTIIAEEQKLFDALGRRFRREKQDVGKPPPEEKQLPSLSATSFGTGESAAYLGEDFAMQYLTSFELGIYECLQAVRENPKAVLPTLKALKTSMSTGTTVWWPTTEGGKEPQSVREGGFAVDEAITAVQRQRVCRPNIGQLSIGLTLAARQHAIDLAYHGIACNGTNTGTDGSSIAHRVSKYGGFGSGAAGSAQLTFGIVRSEKVLVEPGDIVRSWIVGDGDAEQRESRRLLFLCGGAASSMGIGHATARRADVVVEVLVVLQAHTFNDKIVGEMAAAHNDAIDRLAQPFLHQIRDVDPAVSLKMLHSAPNSYIGRIGPPPSMKSITRNTVSSKNTLRHSPPPSTNTPPPDRTEQRAVAPSFTPKKKQFGSPRPLEPTSANKQSRTDGAPSKIFSPIATKQKDPPPQKLPPLRKKPTPPPEDASHTIPEPEERRESFTAKTPVLGRTSPTPMQKQLVEEDSSEQSTKSPSPTKQASPPKKTEPAKDSALETLRAMKPVKTKTTKMVVAKACAKFMLCFMRTKRSRERRSLEEKAKAQEAEYAATRLQSSHRAVDGRSQGAALWNDEYSSRSRASQYAMQEERGYAVSKIASIVRMRKAIQLRRLLAKERELSAIRHEVVGPMVSEAISAAHQAIDSLVWKDRILAIYMKYIPDKIQSFDVMMKRYDGREDVLLQALIDKYGPEEELEQRLSSYYRHYAPNKMDDVHDMLVKYAGHEADLFDSLKDEYGPDPYQHADRLARFGYMLLTRARARKFDQFATRGGDAVAKKNEREFAALVIQRARARQAAQKHAKADIEQPRALGQGQLPSQEGHL